MSMAEYLRNGLDEQALDELFGWIDNAPLSRAKKNVARDFADGVLVAELIAFYAPKIIDLHNYNQSHSAAQKKINWDTLNRRVLAKLKLKLSDSTIQQIVDAKNGALEPVLWDIRRKIIELFPASANRKCISTILNKSASHARGSNASSRARSRGHTASSRAQTANSGTAGSGSGSPSHPKLSKLLPKPEFPPGYNPAVDKISSDPTKSTLPPSLLEASKKYLNMSARVSIENAFASDDNNNIINADGTPSQIIYRGHKMVPYELLVDVQKAQDQLIAVNKELCKKGARAETLIAIKDKRIEELSHQYQQTKQELDDYKYNKSQLPSPSESTSSTTVTAIDTPTPPIPITVAPAPTPPPTASSKPRRVYEDF